MASHDPGRQRQPDAGALEALVAVQPLEQLEHLVGMAHVEADAVVAHKVGLLRRAVSHLDARFFFARSRVLERVGQQSRPQLREHPFVADTVG